MVHITQVSRGLARFADAEILSKLNGGTIKRVAVGTALSLYIKNMENILSKVTESPFISAMGIVDAQNNVDIDLLAEELKRNIPESGVRVDIDVMGMHLADMTLDASDIDNIKHYITNS